MPDRRSPDPGPLGVHLTEQGAHAAIFAANATRVSVVLVDRHGRTERVFPLNRQRHGVWYGDLPGVRAGQRYGLRVDGPWDPLTGHRYNSSKLLLDPYARAIDGEIKWGPEVFGHHVDDRWRPTSPAADVRSTLDSGGKVPVGVVTRPFTADRDRRLVTPWKDSVVYEAHVRGLTIRHPLIPDSIRGTYAALGHPALTDHLRDLGVTALQLLPIQAIGDEPGLARRGVRNYWGYSTLNFFSPEPRYASRQARSRGPRGVLEEFATAVEALHEAGLEILLDVVLNHTNEGGVSGPTTSYRGLDAAAYYRLDASGRDDDVTGTGGSLDFRHPRVVQLALDSLRHWVTWYGVDGFRFDLATTLGRGPKGFDPDHPFLVAMRTDPVLGEVKLVAEPWDCGPDGWQTGRFPPPFIEWNDRFRDDVRSFWLGDFAAAVGVLGEHADPGVTGHGARHLATRLAGSEDLFTTAASTDGVLRGPMASVNFVTAHDGFTMADLTAHEVKNNWANGEGNHDGSDNNRSWNHGVEGAGASEAIKVTRRRSIRNLLGTLLLSTGVPMLTAGDEFGRTQGGNNNAYCLDDPTSWLDWGASGDGDLRLVSWRQNLLDTTTALLRWRHRFSVLRQDTFFADRPVHPDGTTDIAWFSRHGEVMDTPTWQDNHNRLIQMYLHADAVRDTDPDAESLLLVINGGHADTEIRLPGSTWGTAFIRLWDSAYDRPDDVPTDVAPAGSEQVINARAMRLYVVG